MVILAFIAIILSIIKFVLANRKIENIPSSLSNIIDVDKAWNMLSCIIVADALIELVLAIFILFI